MAEDNIDFNLKPMPDGFGFLYGELHKGDEHHRLDIMPPLPHWQGDVMMDDYGPHETDWVVYVDGEEIARVKAREDIEHAAVKALTKS